MVNQVSRAGRRIPTCSKGGQEQGNRVNQYGQLGALHDAHGRGRMECICYGWGGAGEVEEV